MKETIKTRSSGTIIFIVLFLVLVMGLFTFLSRYSNEQHLIKKGFVTLQRNVGTIKSKIRTVSINKYSKKPDKSKFVNYIDKGITIKFQNTGKANSSPDSIIRDTLKISGSFFSDILDREFFDEYIIFDSTKFLYKSLEPEVLDQGQYLKGLKKNIYLPANYRIFSGKKDSALIHTTWNTGFISKTIINYTKYYQFVYPLKINNTTYYISGLLTSQNYLEKKRHVETWVLILIGIILIFTLFSFQFIKLFMLSKTERINTSDIVLICFSISGIACILTLLILNTYALSGIKKNTEKQLAALNDSIKNNFVVELKLMYSTTEAYEKYKKVSSRVKKHVLSDNIWQEINPDLYHTILKYPYFKGLFCSGNGISGNIITSWEADTASKISYRKYYQAKDEWILPGNNEDKRFRLQSIYSNTTGEVSAVLAKPSDSMCDTVYCISSPMYSVINTILPPGFEFRIIGEDGLVWFHNDQKKNNRENFLEECDYNGEMLEAIHNRIKSCIPMRISLKDFQTYISPIGKLPLYLVTMYNTSPQNEFLSHQNYILFIFILLGVFCGLVATGLFYYEKLNTASGKSEQINTGSGLKWILPDTTKNERYLVIFALNIFMGLIILIALFFLKTTIIHILLILFTAYSLCFIYFYFLLKKKEDTIKLSVPVTFSVLVVICNFVYLICLPDYMPFLLFEFFAVLMILLCLLVVLKKKHELFVKKIMPARVQKIISGVADHTYLPYVMFVFSWIIISCVLPTILLFKTAGKEEVELFIKKNQVEMASRIEKKNLLIDDFYISHIYPVKTPLIDHPGIDTIKTNLKHKGNYMLDQYESGTIEGYEESFSGADPDTGYLKLNRFLRQMILREDIRSYQMFYGAGLDTMWYWMGGKLSSSNSDRITLFYSAKQKNEKGFYSGYTLRLSSILRNPEAIDRTTGYFQSGIFLLFFVFLFVFILIVVRILFVLKITAHPDTITFLGISHQAKVFLISTMDQDRIKEFYSGSHTVITPANPGKCKTAKNILILFNPSPEKIDEWHPVMKALGERVEKNNGSIIFVSCYTPIQIINITEQQIQEFQSPDMKASYREIRQDLIRLFSFFKVHFLKTHQNSRSFSKSQFQYLWEKCTLKEKFILSDLAIDSVVNAKNQDDINSLIGKGILAVEGKLCFADRYFEQYVLQLADTEEFASLDKNSKRSDGWNKIKVPLYIIFGAVVLFFFFTQQDIFSGIYAAIVSLTGLLGSFLKFGVFGKSTNAAN